MHDPLDDSGVYPKAVVMLPDVMPDIGVKPKAVVMFVDVIPDIGVNPKAVVICVEVSVIPMVGKFVNPLPFPIKLLPRMVPLTSNVYAGRYVPIPTLPDTMRLPEFRLTLPAMRVLFVSETKDRGGLF